VTRSLKKQLVAQWLSGHGACLSMQTKKSYGKSKDSIRFCFAFNTIAQFLFP
jgi:hypothetical protein